MVYCDGETHTCIELLRPPLMGLPSPLIHWPKDHVTLKNYSQAAIFVQYTTFPNPYKGFHILYLSHPCHVQPPNISLARCCNYYFLKFHILFVSTLMYFGRDCQLVPKFLHYIPPRTKVLYCIPLTASTLML